MNYCTPESCLGCRQGRDCPASKLREAQPEPEQLGPFFWFALACLFAACAAAYLSR